MAGSADEVGIMVSQVIQYILEGYIFVCGKNNINNGNNPYIGLIVME